MQHDTEFRMSRQWHPPPERSSGFPGRSDYTNLSGPTRGHPYPHRYPHDRSYSDNIPPPDIHRPESWRPDRAHFRELSSPDRYMNEGYRSHEPNSWSRPAWDSYTSAPWPSERRPPSPWGERRRRDPTLLFEPSEAWKQSHRDESPVSTTRRMHDGAPPLEPLSGRSEYPPAFAGNGQRPGDPGYNPHEYPPHGRASSYRPDWEDSDDHSRWEPPATYRNETYHRDRRASFEPRSSHTDHGWTMGEHSVAPTSRPELQLRDRVPRAGSPMQIDILPSLHQRASPTSVHTQQQRKRIRTRSPSTSSEATRPRPNEVRGHIRKGSTHSTGSNVHRRESVSLPGETQVSTRPLTAAREPSGCASSLSLSTPSSASVTSGILVSPRVPVGTAKLPVRPISNGEPIAPIGDNSSTIVKEQNTVRSMKGDDAMSAKPTEPGQTEVTSNGEASASKEGSSGDNVKPTLSGTPHSNVVQGFPSPSTLWPSSKPAAKAVPLSPTNSRGSLGSLRFTKKRSNSTADGYSESPATPRTEVSRPDYSIDDTKASAKPSRASTSSQIDSPNANDGHSTSTSIKQHSETLTRSDAVLLQPNAGKQETVPATTPASHKPSLGLNMASETPSLDLEHPVQAKVSAKAPVIEKKPSSTIKATKDDVTRERPRGVEKMATANNSIITKHESKSPEVDPLIAAKTISDALRLSVIQRVKCDRQTRDERINPVLAANNRLAHTRPLAQVDKYLDDTEITERKQDNLCVSGGPRASLVARFAERKAVLDDKVQNLRDEYLTLHERWVLHCARLGDTDRDRLSAGPDDGTLTSAGARSTRRSGATHGDAVRSDLEMEQIIASLGNEELTDPNHLAIRNVAQIPDMLSVVHGHVEFFYDDTNNEVLNPASFYAPRTGFEDWTEEEKEIFNEKFAAHPKQFGIIADSLPHKTSSQCVAYYYLHKKKFIDFRKVITKYAPNKKRRGGRGGGKQRGNALLTDIRRHDEEVSQGRSTRVRKPRFVQTEATPTPTPEPEAGIRQRKKRAARPVSFVEVDDGDDGDPKPKRAPKRGRKPKVTANPDESTPPPVATEESIIEWSETEKRLFIDLLEEHGSDFEAIAKAMPGKAIDQIRVYFDQNQESLGLDDAKSRLKTKTTSLTTDRPRALDPISYSNDVIAAAQAWTRQPFASYVEPEKIFGGGPGAAIPYGPYGAYRTPTPYSGYTPQLVPDWEVRVSAGAGAGASTSYPPPNPLPYPSIPSPMQLWSSHAAAMYSAPQHYAAALHRAGYGQPLPVSSQQPSAAQGQPPNSTGSWGESDGYGRGGR